MTTPGGPAVLAALLPLVPGCMFEGWAGAGAVRVPGVQAETRRVWTLGASFGFYLERARSRVRVAIAAHSDKTYVNAPSVTTTDPMSAGTMWGAGGEVRITRAISPDTILGYLGMAVTATSEAPRPVYANPDASASTPAPPTPPTTCRTTTTCTTSANGDQFCVPFTRCN